MGWSGENKDPFRPHHNHLWDAFKQKYLLPTPLTRKLKVKIQASWKWLLSCFINKWVLAFFEHEMTVTFVLVCTCAYTLQPCRRKLKDPQSHELGDCWISTYFCCWLSTYFSGLCKAPIKVTLTWWLISSGWLTTISGKISNIFCNAEHKNIQKSCTCDACKLLFGRSKYTNTSQIIYPSD